MVAIGGGLALMMLVALKFLSARTGPAEHDTIVETDKEER